MGNLDFCIKNYQIIKSDNDIDLSQIPNSIKRKLSNIDKIVLSLLCKTFEPEVNEIVFSSVFGEYERLKSIIEQYKTYNEVSPMQFTGSVFNYPIGCFNQITKSNIPYTALSADNNSVSAGIIKSVISKNQNVLFCYADYIEENPKGTAMIIGKNKFSEDCQKYELELLNNEPQTDEFEDLCNFLSGNMAEFNSNICKIKRFGR